MLSQSRGGKKWNQPSKSLFDQSFAPVHQIETKALNVYKVYRIIIFWYNIHYLVYVSNIEACAAVYTFLSTLKLSSQKDHPSKIK